MTAIAHFDDHQVVALARWLEADLAAAIDRPMWTMSTKDAEEALLSLTRARGQLDALLMRVLRQAEAARSSARGGSLASSSSSSSAAAPVPAHGAGAAPAAAAQPARAEAPRFVRLHPRGSVFVHDRSMLPKIALPELEPRFLM